jgi:hypothetical protein
MGDLSSNWYVCVWIPLQLVLSLENKIIGVLCAGTRQDDCAPRFDSLTITVAGPRDGAVDTYCSLWYLNKG